MDRGYNPSSEVFTEDTELEKPIIPMKDLGQTVPEKDPVTGGNILQNIDAAIRAGAGNIQIAMNVSSQQPIGGRPKAYGKEVRQAIKEKAQAAGVVIEGVEMPTSSMTNLSGYDPQRNTVSEQKRKQDMDEVKDAIKFVADIAGGGEVDIWSQEFPRTIFDAKWNKFDREGNPMFKLHDKEHKEAVKTLMDSRTGEIINAIRMNQEIYYPVWERNEEGQYVDYTGKVVDRKDRKPKFDMEKNEFVVANRTISSFTDEQRELNEMKAQELGKSVNELGEDERITVEEAFMRASMEANEQIARGWAGNYSQDMRQSIEMLRKLEKDYEAQKGAFDKVHSPAEKAALTDPETGLPKHEVTAAKLEQIRQRVEYSKEMATGQLREAENIANRKKFIVTPDKYAKKKSIESYADLGIYAMNETQNNPQVTKDIYVGPELGWPYAFGGHPDEFMELINKSRDRMAEKLRKEYNMGSEEAKKRAERHLKGTFDTSHLGMWLAHFREKKGETPEQRLKAFNKWFVDKSEELAKSGTVGAIQAVDSASAAHGHLPPGQGIFPVVEAVKKFKEHGFKGAIVSEGHEEEGFGRGRILLETWRAFGTPIHQTGYEPTGLPFSWPGVSNQYQQYMQPAYFTRQDFAPDQREWTLWSQAPLE